MSLALVTAPTVDPVTESEVWNHLRLTLTGSPAEPEDKALVQALIKAAVSHLDGRDGILGRCLVQQTWDYTLHRFPADSIALPLAPVRSITSVTYTDTAGTTQTFADYFLSADTDWSPALHLNYEKTWPETRDIQDAVKIRFVAGYDDDGASPPDYRANVPQALKQAILLIVGHLYENREASAPVQVHDVPMAVKALISPYRRWAT